MRLLLTLPVLALGSMALWLTVVIALTCFGGLASLGPVPPSTALKELIEELVNITQNQKAPLCNGSMVWSVNLTANMQVSSKHIRDTKIEVAHFLKDLLKHSRIIFRYRKFS
ncbi:hypothetical protein E2I00_002371 [Balaenoptera physalus]|uniref:Interleukin-13 n=1 Tax=Balaenoptera physalus TaxID=9770 RepID=A0A6A1QCW8_BALPH|nr:hypothetical protein E2I00_002371 [Balaenoptera physalus]